MTALEKLEKIAKLEDNWNQYGASKFSEVLIEKVKRILPTLEYELDIFPTARDSIQLEYEFSNGDYFELEIYEDHITTFKMINDIAFPTLIISEEEINDHMRNFFNKERE